MLSEITQALKGMRNLISPRVYTESEKLDPVEIESRVPISIAWGEKKGRGEASQPTVSKRGGYKVQRCYYNRWFKMTAWDRDLYISFKEEEKLEKMKKF